MIEAQEIMKNGACDFDNDQLSILIGVTRDNGSKMDTICNKIDTLSGQHKDIIRWLLLVVCVVALGSKGMEMVNSLWGKRPPEVYVSKP